MIWMKDKFLNIFTETDKDEKFIKKLSKKIFNDEKKRLINDALQINFSYYLICYGKVEENTISVLKEKVYEINDIESKLLSLSTDFHSYIKNKSSLSYIYESLSYNQKKIFSEIKYEFLTFDNLKCELYMNIGSYYDCIVYDATDVKTYKESIIFMSK